MTTTTHLPSVAELAESSIPARFEDSVRRYAGDLAVSSIELGLTFDALNRAANRVAHTIIDRIGTAPAPVVLVADRNPWAVVGLIAVAKAGKFVVPIYPKNNEDRMLDAVLAEIGKPLVLVHGQSVAQLRSLVPPERRIDLDSPHPVAADTNPGLALGPDDLACVIYTSGSTGLPKGVVHNHRNILHRIFWYAERFGVGAGDRSMMLSSVDHISGIVGMLRPLLTGAKLRFLDLGTQGFEGLAGELQRERITLLPIVNTVFRRFVDNLGPEAQFPALRLIILGGETLLEGDIERYRRIAADSCLLLNTLGCTELPTYRYLAIDKRYAMTGAPVPAGHAVPGIGVAIVDPDGQPVPPGELGEIVVRSRYLALGYWNRPHETAERFTTSDTGERTFRTGDLGRLQENGILVHLGRADSMLKILGNRVEVTEVEDAVRRCPGVREVAVRPWPDDTGEPRLYAYVVAEPGHHPVPREVRDFVRGQLPDYMVPVAVLLVADLPLTRTGKTDRRALPPPPAIIPGPRPAIVAPRDETERELVAIWESVLNVAPVSVHDHFLDLGGQSLLAMSLLARVEKDFGTTLSPADLFAAPTIGCLAGMLRRAHQPSDVVDDRHARGTG